MSGLKLHKNPGRRRSRDGGNKEGWGERPATGLRGRNSGGAPRCGVRAKGLGSLLHARALAGRGPHQRLVVVRHCSPGLNVRLHLHGPSPSC